jgi:hypothetical protein
MELTMKDDQSLQSPTILYPLKKKEGNTKELEECSSRLLVERKSL